MHDLLVISLPVRQVSKSKSSVFVFSALLRLFFISNSTDFVGEDAKTIFAPGRRVPYSYTTDRDRVIYVQLPPLSRHVVARLDKVIYDNYLCLVASNKQQLN